MLDRGGGVWGTAPDREMLVAETPSTMAEAA